jgi:hypothetical protein
VLQGRLPRRDGPAGPGSGRATANPTRIGVDSRDNGAGIVQRLGRRLTKPQMQVRLPLPASPCPFLNARPWRAERPGASHEQAPREPTKRDLLRGRCSLNQVSRQTRPRLLLDRDDRPVKDEDGPASYRYGRRAEPNPPGPTGHGSNVHLVASARRPAHVNHGANARTPLSPVQRRSIHRSTAAFGPLAENPKRPELRAVSVVERTGIEPVTSGLQRLRRAVLSGANRLRS